MFGDSSLPSSSPLPTYSWTNTEYALPAIRQACIDAFVMVRD